MKCNNCGNEFAIHIRGGYDKNEKGERVHWERCDKCGGIRVEGIPDVSDVHEPYFDEHLADIKHPEGQWVNSRRDKADKLKALGLREKRESNVKYIKDTDARRRYFQNKFGG